MSGLSAEPEAYYFQKLEAPHAGWQAHLHQQSYRELGTVL
jgi:hypothetical protein